MGDDTTLTASRRNRRTVRLPMIRTSRSVARRDLFGGLLFPAWSGLASDVAGTGTAGRGAHERQHDLYLSVAIQTSDSVTRRE